MVVDGARCYHVLSCFFFVPHSQIKVGATPYLCIFERNSPTPIRRQLSLTHAGLGKNISNGAALRSAIGATKCFFVTPCSICNLLILLHCCLIKQDRSAIPVLQAQMGVTNLSCTDAHKIGTQSFRGGDVLDLGRGELETAWLFGGEAQLVGSQLEQRDCPLE